MGRAYANAIPGGALVKFFRAGAGGFTKPGYMEQPAGPLCTAARVSEFPLVGGNRGGDRMENLQFANSPCIPGLEPHPGRPTVTIPNENLRIPCVGQRALQTDIFSTNGCWATKTRLYNNLRQ